MPTNPNQAEVEQLVIQVMIDQLGGPIKAMQEMLRTEQRLKQLLNEYADNEAATRQEALVEGRLEALKLIAKQSAWEDSYDHFARQLGLVTKYGHSCQSCAAPTHGRRAR